MRSALGLLVLVVAMAVGAPTAHAQATVTVSLTPEGQQFADQIGITPEELAAQIKNRVDEAYGTSDIKGFLKGFTNATSFSARGIGVDYGSTPKGLIFGVAANLAASGDDLVFDEDHPTAGLAANIAVMAGLNLKQMKLPKWTVYANGFYRSGSTDQLKGHITSLGAHVQYRLINASEGGGAGTVARWLGLSLTTGIEYTKWRLGTTSSGIETSIPVIGDGENAQLSLDSQGQFDLLSTATTIPLEVTTGVRIAVIMSLYAGAGVDITAGHSTVAAGLSGTIVPKDGDTNYGTVDINAFGKGDGSPAAPRALAGVQFNLTALRIFAQANVAATPAVSVAFGVRLVF